MSEHPYDQAARKIYDGNQAAPPAPAATPTEDAARRMYGDNFVASTIDRRLGELFDVDGKSGTSREALRQNLIDIGKTGLPDATIAALAEAFVDGELAAARAEDPDAHADALNKQGDIWNEELRNNLRVTYGLKDGEQLLERAKKFARSHPRLAQVLQSHGIGSRPEIVEAIVAHVFSTGYR